MASIPGYCEHCGHVFDGRGGINVENSTNITITGSRMTCPRCGRMAKLVDGVFNERGAGLELVSGPPITHAILGQLYGIARKAKDGEITPQQAVEEAAKIDPRLGRLFERFLSLGLTAFAALFAFLAYQLQQSQFELQKVDSAASGQFYEQALELLERQATALEEKQDRQRVEPQRGAPAAKQADKKPPSVKSPSKRRVEVKKQRRIDLKERRRMFPPRPPRFSS